MIIADHLARLFRGVAEAHPDRVATRIKSGYGYTEQTHAQFAAAVRRSAAGLLGKGIQPGDRVTLLSSNRPEWTEADLALLSVGAVVVPIFPSSTPEQIRHIINDSGSRAVIIDGAPEATKLAQVRDELTAVEFVASFDAVDQLETQTWATLRSDDEDLLRQVDERVAAADIDEIATLIYTSGTTGEPKGVILTHRNFASEFVGLDELFTLRPEDHSLCFLPLSHALERAWTYYVLLHGCANTYLHNPKQVADALTEVRPTLFVCVPALYEKVFATVKERVAGSAVRRRIFAWALRVGGRIQHQARKGRPVPPWWLLQRPLADRLVFRAVRDAIGGPKTVLAAGGAPLRTEVEEFFSACGVLVCQGYGLTEAAPLISFNAPGAFKFGTVGQVMGGGHLKIGADSEILYQGPNTMRGYWNNEQATADAFTSDGYLRTGDVGYVDNQGFLVITDRLKDLLVTSNGKNIAPQPIEGLILADPLFEHAVVIGNNRPAVTMLVRPSLPHLEELAEQLQIRWENREDLLNQPQITEAIKQRVAALTEKLPRHEQVTDLRLLLEEFTQENGLLTPTLKVRRREVEKRFSDLIDDMYTRLADLRKRR